jgi:RNA polymerase sigma-70 factor (ECF subfamily)
VSAPLHRDLVLARRCLRHEPGAFDELYRAHAPRLFGLACRMVGRRDAEDLVQEALLTAYRRLAGFRGESSLGTWLFRLTLNACTDHLRRARTRANVWACGITRDLPSGSNSGPIHGVVDRLDLRPAIRALPDRCRAVFVMHDVVGFGHEEIGERLGIAVGTSKSQLHRARQALRESLSRSSMSLP